MPRTATGPRSQNMAMNQGVGELLRITPISRAADGDRPRTVC
jgi:hypothetical protein